MPEKERWITLANGNRCRLDENGVVTAGPKMFQGRHISQCGGPLADTSPDTEGYARAVAAHGGDHYAGARQFFQEKLQGRSVTCRTADGEKEAQFTGGTWREIKRDMKGDPIKAALVPHMPDIIATGTYRRNAPHKPRKDGIRSFHEYRKTLQTAEGPREVIVDVAEYPNRRAVHQVYSMTREGSGRYDERKKKESPSGNPGSSPAYNGDSSNFPSMSSGRNLITRKEEFCCDTTISPALEVVNLRLAEGKAMPRTLTLDAAPSRRRLDENGFLHVDACHLTREQVAPYYGREIPGWEELGLDPERLYFGLRPAEELKRAVPTVNGLPILWGHSPESAEDPQLDRRIGSMGTDAAFNAPFLDNSLIFTVQEAIDAIQDGRERELSLSYRYEPDFSAPGTFEGQPYDFVMRNLRGNHLALVPEGRAGAACCVADAAPQNAKQPQPKEGFMKIVNKLARKFRGARDEDPAAAKDEKDLADVMLDLFRTNPETGEMVDMVADEDKAAEIRKIVAEMAGELPPEKMEALTSALTDLAYSRPTGDGEAPKAADEDMKSAMDKCGLDADDPAAQAAFAEGVKYGEKLMREPAEREKLDSEHESEGLKKAEDEDEPARAVDEEKVAQTASDAALRRFQAILDAQAEVRPHVGEMRVNLAQDSAASIYGAALDALGVDRKGTPAAAWRGMFRVAVARGRESAPALAQDAAPAKGPLAGLNNITTL